MFTNIFACVNVFIQKVTCINFVFPNEARDESIYALEQASFCLLIGFAISNSAV